MIKIILSITTITAVWLFAGFDRIGEFFTAHNLANIGLIILTVITAAVSSQLRLTLEKVENILSLYAKFTHPDSKNGENLSEAEQS